LILALFGSFNVFSVIFANPILFICGIIAYFVVGVAWSFVKWYLFNKDRSTLVSELKAEYLAREARPLDQDGQQLPQDDYRIKDWQAGFDRVLERHDLSELNAQGQIGIRPYAKNHKSVIMTWIAYWPFSVTWSLVDDFVRRVVKAIYNSLSGAYQGLSDRVVSDQEGKLEQ
jgi:hypothetical protein